MKAEILKNFEPISLESMSAVKLMNRVDTKFVTTLDKLYLLLERLGEEYFIQDADGLRSFPYHTVYFDTPDLRMYSIHHCGKKQRHKIRMRTYVNTGEHFLEIKRKNNKGRTRKKRIGIERMHTQTELHTDFIGMHSPYDASILTPQVENRFRRITLVNRNFTERMTIDTGLEFNNLQTGIAVTLPNIVIIELKRDGAVPSPAIKHLLQLRIGASGFSKYCMGVAFTNPNVKHNRFKERMRRVMKMNTPQIVVPVLEVV